MGIWGLIVWDSLNYESAIAIEPKGHLSKGGTIDLIGQVIFGEGHIQKEIARPIFGFH